MLKLSPILLAALYGLIMWQFSLWRMKADLNQRGKELHDAEFNTLLAPMARALDLPRIKVHLLEMDAVNGLASGDGRIFLTTGFWAKYKNGEVTGPEMASVIAHEMGHIALGHTRRRMIDFAGQNALRSALAMVLGRFIPGLGVWVANMLASLLAAKLSRGDEFEADAYASALLIKSGIGTNPQKSLFEKLPKLTGAHAATPAWLLSHPSSEDRISAIEANEARWVR